MYVVYVESCIQVCANTVLNLKVYLNKQLRIFDCGVCMCARVRVYVRV